MVIHTHPEIQADILELGKSLTSEIGASEEQAEVGHVQDKGRAEVRHCRVGNRHRRAGVPDGLSRRADIGIAKCAERGVNLPKNLDKLPILG